jgi:hypothetical protein
VRSAIFTELIPKTQQQNEKFEKKFCAGEFSAHPSEHGLQRALKWLYQARARLRFAEIILQAKEHLR